MKAQDIADLKQLIEFLKEYQVAEFDLDRGDLKIRLKFNQQETAPAGLNDLARLLATAPPGVAQAAAAEVHARLRLVLRHSSRPAITSKKARSSASSKP